MWGCGDVCGCFQPIVDILIREPGKRFPKVIKLWRGETGSCYTEDSYQAAEDLLEKASVYYGLPEAEEERLIDRHEFSVLKALPAFDESKGKQVGIRGR